MTNNLRISEDGVAFIKVSTIDNYKKPHATRPLWNAVVSFLIERDGHLCNICSTPLVKPINVDHIIPRSVGGQDRLENLRVVHARCIISFFRKNFKTKPHPPRSVELRKKMSECGKRQWEEIKQGLRQAPAYAVGVRSNGQKKRWALMSQEQRTKLAEKIWIKRRANAANAN